jgi:peptidoglycan/xylan/chitin deacetylase (PgdA/CDA1 family)
MSRVEALVDRGLARSPLLPLFRARTSRRLTVLAYHGVDDAERFAGHLDEIRLRGHAVTLTEALDGIEGATLPRNPVLITFDDGARSVFEVGAPLLRERGLPAVAFVVAGSLDGEQPLWFDEVRDLVRRGGRTDVVPDGSPDAVVRSLKRLPDARRRAAIDELRAIVHGPKLRIRQLDRSDLLQLESMGVAVGNHSMTHPCLSRCEDGSVEREITLAHEQLTRALGRAPRAFAYPDGDDDPRAAAILRELGYRAGFLFDHRPAMLPAPDPMRISRVRVNAWTTPDRFRLILSGLHPALHHARGGR